MSLNLLDGSREHGRAEVCDLHYARQGEKHVLGLDVPVDDSLAG